MDDNSNIIESLYHRTEEYVKTSFEILKLKTLEKSTEVASSIIIRFILIAVLLMCLLILSLGVSLWLGEMLDKIYNGFMIVAAFWAVIGIILYFFLYKRIKKLISDSIIKNVLENHE
jgi:Na+/melibiose symporter-like transporter